jgi:AcrR family transcriptional regulator
MRKTSPERLEAIAEAALTLFTGSGYRLTQVSDIAAAAGVSAGSIYNYANGKEALLLLAVLRALERCGDVTVPLGPVSLADVVAAIDAAFTPETTDWPEIGRAARDASLPFRPTLAAVIDELFAYQSRRRRFIWLLDRLSLEMPDVHRIHVLGAKARYMAVMTDFLCLHRPEPPEIAAALARGVLEAVVWFSMHRHRDRSFPALDEATALALARTMVLDGIAGSPLLAADMNRR